jgi:23S rRNA (pseudouridine1915-N3)-methyltransferase
MKLLFIFVGKTSEAYLREGIELYSKRISNYISASITVIPASSEKKEGRIIDQESINILSKLLPGDYVVLLDEKGSEIDSRALAKRFEKWMLQSVNRVVFITGGAYGVSSEIKKRADMILSLSRLTFTHQMVRLFLLEQVYRAMTIIRNEGYHHD